MPSTAWFRERMGDGQSFVHRWIAAIVLQPNSLDLRASFRQEFDALTYHVRSLGQRADSLELVRDELEKLFVIADEGDRALS